MQVKYNSIFIDVKKGTKVIDLLKEEINKSKKFIIACRFNNEVKRLDYEIFQDGEIELVDLTTKDGMEIYRRGLIYIVSKAVSEIYTKALLTVNYQLSNSLLVEIDNMNVTDKMIEEIQKKVKEIIEKDLPITRKSMTKQEAQEFYKKEKTLKGKIQFDMRDSVTLYFCEDYYNYFFGVLPLSTGCIKKYEIIRYHDGFLVRYPSMAAPDKLPEYVEHKKLLAALDEYEDLHKILNVNTAYKLNKAIADGKIREYILLDEALHENRIVKITEDILKTKGKRLILIAGPSSSGKTTFARRLEIQLRINSLKPVTISVDNYFVDREHTPKDEKGNYDFETIKAVDIELFNKQLKDLLSGKEVEIPKFDFKIGKKYYDGTKLKLGDNEVLIVEGIHCLNDELTYLIPGEQKYKIYISALTVLNLDYYNRISTTDTRLIRRIIRDDRTRGHSPVQSIKRLESVSKGEEKNIFRFQEEADNIFNSSLIYEFGVLKNYVMPLLETVDDTNPEYSEAKRLHNLLSYFNPIPAEYVPDNSLLKEFIGGSIFEE